MSYWFKGFSRYCLYWDYVKNYWEFYYDEALLFHEEIFFYNDERLCYTNRLSFNNISHGGASIACLGAI